MKHSACRIENELLSFEGAVGGQDEDVAGELRVSAIANMASTVLMPYFARFSAAHPKVELSVQVTNNSVRLSEPDRVKTLGGGGFRPAHGDVRVRHETHSWH